MASINDAFPSRYLKSEDLQGDETCTIQKAGIEGVGQNKDQKLVIKLKETEKEFVCNKTNAKTIAGIHGDDFDQWRNKEITLYAKEVEFQGEMVWSIRVRLARQIAPAAARPAAAAPARRPAPAAAPADDGDVPY